MARRESLAAVLLLGLAATAGLQGGPTWLDRHQAGQVPAEPASLLGSLDAGVPVGASPGAPAVPAGLPVLEAPSVPAPSAAVPPAPAGGASSPYDALLAASGTDSGAAIAGGTTPSSAPPAPGTLAYAEAAAEKMLRAGQSEHLEGLVAAGAEAGGFARGGASASASPRGLEEAMAALYAALGQEFTPRDRASVHDQALALDPRLRGALTSLVEAAAEAQLTLARAFGDMDPADLALLAACTGPRLPQGELPCSDTARAAELAEEQVDRGAVAAASSVVAGAVDRALPALRQLRSEALRASAEGIGLPEDLLLDREGDADDDEFFQDPKGLVEIGGLGNDVYLGNLMGGADDRVQVLTVDLLGNDFYANTAGGASLQVPDLNPPDPEDLQPHADATVLSYGTLVSISVDVAGDDTYQGTYGVQGSGRLGLGLLLDAAGNDRYSATSESQGFGSTGVGLLLDLDGIDQYACDFDCQGHGRVGGLGLLFERLGSDVYTGRSWTQGVGANQGVGYLLDAAGNDRYTAMASGLTVSQGATDRAGVGVLVDLAGTDAYSISGGGRGYVAGLFPYNVGTAAFRDRGAGADTYSGVPGANNARWQQGNAGSGDDA